MKNPPTQNFFFILNLKYEQIGLIKPLGAKPLEARGETAGSNKRKTILPPSQQTVYR